MWIKRKELELIEQALARGVDARRPLAHALNLAAWKLVKKLLALPDPMDVVPVHDYPFPLPVTEDPSK